MLLLVLVLACFPRDRERSDDSPQGHGGDDTGVNADDTGSPDDTSSPSDDTGGGDDTSPQVDDTGTADDTGTEPVTCEPGTQDVSLTVDGIARSYTVYVPASAVITDEPAPLLLGLHGAGDTGSNFISATRLTRTADDNAFVLVGPNGWGGGWFVSDSEGWPGADGTTNSYANDIAFMITLIKDIGEACSIDNDRIFTVGHSRGAGFSAMLAVASGQVSTSLGTYTSPFAAHAVNAGYDPFGGGLDLASTSPQNPVWVIHGTSDTSVPYSYGLDLADSLEAAGWDVTWTPVKGASHTWLFQSAYGQDNQDLWDWLLEAAG